MLLLLLAEIHTVVVDVVGWDLAVVVDFVGWVLGVFLDVVGQDS